jgi:hypothetical protein
MRGSAQGAEGCSLRSLPDEHDDGHDLQQVHGRHLAGVLACWRSSWSDSGTSAERGIRLSNEGRW